MTMTESPIMNKAHIARVLDRAGNNSALVDEMLMLFHDPVDEAQLETVVRRYGITRGVLMSRLGGSP